MITLCTLLPDILLGMSVSERIPGEKAVRSHVFWGRHFFASYTGCKYDRLTAKELPEVMREAIKASGATLISDDVHFFPNGGMTAVFLLKESHASVHTYPEHKACFVDLFTCGDKTRTEAFDARLRLYLEPTHTDGRVYLRHETNQDSYAAVCLENDGGLSQIVYAGQTDHQKVLIADSPKYGRILVLDGELQSAESDEALYHEMLVQPPMVLHPNPRRVLIIGAGEGASLREVLKHKSVESVTVVDLDETIIDLSKVHLSKWHQGSFDDPRVQLVIADGRQFIEESTNKYDVVIIDVVDAHPDGPAGGIYKKQFFELLKKRLSPGALVAMQAMKVSDSEYSTHASMRKTLKSVFCEVHSCHLAIPSFFCDWSFLIASEWSNPSRMSAKAFDDALSTRIGAEKLKHLDGEFFLSCFHFTRSLRSKLENNGVVLED